MQPVIELEGLEVRFGERVILNRLTAALTGRAIGLLGPNGAGKSTLINTLLGFHKPSAGTARVLGRDVRSHAREIRALIGYMPESDSFIAPMSGVRFVRMMAELSGLPPEAALERAHEAFFYVGLGEVRYRPLGSYSLGMKQAAKLASAIAHGPKLLFLDEPTNGLDPPARTRMIQLIQEIRDRGDLSLILSSHLLRDVEETCDQVLILKNGRLAAFCNLEEERRANLRFLELETRGSNNGDFLAAVDRLGCQTATGAQGRIKLILPDGVEVRQLYEIAAEQNVQLRRLSHKRDSLEDIFLKAMEEPTADTVPGGTAQAGRSTPPQAGGPTPPQDAGPMPQAGRTPPQAGRSTQSGTPTPSPAGAPTPQQAGAPAPPEAGSPTAQGSANGRL